MTADSIPRSGLIAPDKFRGSLSAPGVADAVGAALAQVFPNARVYKHPIADGGEGTVDMVLRHGFRSITTEVRRPIAGHVSATFALREDTAVIEWPAPPGCRCFERPVPLAAPSTT